MKKYTKAKDVKISFLFQHVNLFNKLVCTYQGKKINHSTFQPIKYKPVCAQSKKLSQELALL